MALGKHMNGNAWTSSRRKRRALALYENYEREREREMSHAIINRANTCRVFLLRASGQVLAAQHGGSVEPSPFELRDTVAGTWCGTEVTGRAQSARCMFCGKQFAAWGKRKKRSTSWPKELTNGYNDHIGPCSLAWLRLTVARWATGQLTDGEAWWFERWRANHAKPRTDGWDRDPFNELPPELADLFDYLPAKPGSDVAHALEVSLIAISRVWGPL